VLNAETAADVLARRGRFALVEGRVVSVRESGATIYVNFGRRWSEDFTVTVLKRNERNFTAAGLDFEGVTAARLLAAVLLQVLVAVLGVLVDLELAVVVEDRQVADVPVDHGAQRLMLGRLLGRGDEVDGADLGHLRRRRIAPLEHDLAHDVALGEQALQIAVVDDHARAGAVLRHRFDRLEDRRRRRHHRR